MQMKSDFQALHSYMISSSKENSCRLIYFNRCKFSFCCSMCIFQRVLQKEKQRMKHANAANTKLLHECNLLRDRLQECSVNFLSEEEDKLIVDTSSPSDALDLLTTSDNRISLLLAEVFFAHRFSFMNSLY